MKHKVPSKVCLICKENFIPDPRVGDRQKVCSKSYCKLQRKKLAQQHWLAKNPGYFQGRYPQLQDQIRANKKNKAPTRPPAWSGIQDELSSNQNKLLTALQYIRRIQDEITRHITTSNDWLQDCLALVYKTS